MYAKVEEAKLGVYLLSLLSAIALMTVFALIAVIVMYATTLASVAMLDYVPDHTLAKGAAMACTALLGAFAMPAYIERWERKFVVLSWKNGL